MFDHISDPIRSGGHWVFPDGTRLPVVGGGDGPDEGPAPIERPENIEALTVVQLRDLHGTISARIGELQAIEARTLADARELVRLTGLANEIAGLVVEAETVVEVAAGLPPVPAPAPAPAPVEEVAPVVELPAAAAPTAEDQQLAHAAAASLTLDALSGVPATPVPSEEEHTPNMAVFTAAVGSHGVAAAGAEVGYDEIGRMIEHGRRYTEQLVRTVQGGGDVADSDRETRIASITLRDELAAELTLSDMNSATLNTRIINDTPLPGAPEPGAPRTAAICGPADIIRAIPDCIGMGRPIRPLFRNVPSDHAHFQFIPSIGLASVAPGVVIWTDADQALVDEADPSTWKPCVPLVCAAPITVFPKRIPSCLTVEVMQSLSTPEQVANWMATISAQTERVAEGALLSTIDLLSSNYTVATTHYGALTTLYDTLSTLLSMAADINRQQDVSNYVAIVPSGLLRRLGLDNFDREFPVPGELARLMSDLGIRMETTLDFATGGSSPWAGSFPLNPPGAAPIALPTAPDHWRIRLIDPTSGFFFSPDEFAFGTYRDPQLMRQNRLQWFGELFEGLGKNGCAPWFTFDIQLCSNGDRAAGSAPLSCGSLNPLVAIGAPGDPTVNSGEVMEAAGMAGIGNADLLEGSKGKK